MAPSNTFYSYPTHSFTVDPQFPTYEIPVTPNPTTWLSSDTSEPSGEGPQFETYTINRIVVDSSTGNSSTSTHNVSPFVFSHVPRTQPGYCSQAEIRRMMEELRYPAEEDLQTEEDTDTLELDDRDIDVF